MNTPTNPIVRVNSHRAREKLHRLIGVETQGYHSWHREGSWYECPAEHLEEALKIKGIKKATFKDDMSRYVSWS